MKSLIVDDEVFCRNLMTTYLFGTGEVHQASNGDEALAKFNDALKGGDPYDLILLDILMPGRGGHDVAKSIRAAEKEQQPRRKVNIVMLTVLITIKDAMESYCNRQSAVYLNKPISKDALLKLISNLGLGVKDTRRFPMLLATTKEEERKEDRPWPFASQ
jgi:two-component system, chemotaxis family, chemotaxis protein CheY